MVLKIEFTKHALWRMKDRHPNLFEYLENINGKEVELIFKRTYKHRKHREEWYLVITGLGVALAGIFQGDTYIVRTILFAITLVTKRYFKRATEKKVKDVVQIIYPSPQFSVNIFSFFSLNFGYPKPRDEVRVSVFNGRPRPCGLFALGAIARKVWPVAPCKTRISWRIVGRTLWFHRVRVLVGVL